MYDAGAGASVTSIVRRARPKAPIFLRNLRFRTIANSTIAPKNEAADSGPNRNGQLQLVRLSSIGIAAVHAMPFMTVGSFVELYLPLQIPRRHNIALPFRRFHRHIITSLLTVHPRAEPYRIEHSSSRFGSARVLFAPYIIEREHWDPDSVRLALENFEQGGDSARKCSVRFGTVRGCTVRGAQSVHT